MTLIFAMVGIVPLIGARFFSRKRELQRLERVSSGVPRPGDREILLAILIGAALFLAAVWVHLGMIRFARLAVVPASVGSLRLSLSYLIVLASHLLITALFALGFAAAAAFGLGGFDKEPAMSAMDLYYFSLINITTLGLGDIYPTGHLRALAGIEALTGFLVISCTAQFVFSTMKKLEN